MAFQKWDRVRPDGYIKINPWSPAAQSTGATARATVTSGHLSVGRTVCCLAKVVVTLSPSSLPLAMWSHLKLTLTKAQSEERLSVDGVSMVFWEEYRTIFQHIQMPKSKAEVASSKRNHFWWSWMIIALLGPLKCVCRFSLFWLPFWLKTWRKMCVWCFLLKTSILYSVEGRF